MKSHDEIPTVPPGFMMVEFAVDENGKETQKIIRGGQSKCCSDAEDILKELSNTKIDGYANPTEEAKGLTNEGEEWKTEQQEKMEKERVQPSRPVKPVTPSKPTPPKKKGRQLFNEV